MATPDGAAPKPKDGWDKTSITVDIVHKVIILIIGSVLAGLFYMFQERQAESRYFSDLMSQRESSESQLRAQMFKTLFDAYFANKLAKPDQGSAQKMSSTPSAALDRLKQESMFVDLLSRNFENVDVRPLFEDLDAQLTTLLNAQETRITASPPKMTDLQRQTFLARERLRQRPSEHHPGRSPGRRAAHATVTTHQITQCEDHEPRLEPPLPLADVHPIVDKLKDGMVSMRLVPDSELEPLYLQVTFYDMPSREHSASNQKAHRTHACTLHLAQRLRELQGGARRDSQGRLRQHAGRQAGMRQGVDSRRCAAQGIYRCARPPLLQ